MTTRNKFIIGLAVLAAIIVSGILAYANQATDNPIDPVGIDRTNRAQDQNKEADVKKDAPVITDDSSSEDGSEDDSQSTENEPNSPATDVQVGIVDAGQYDNTVEVRAFVEGAIDGSGVCTAIFTKNGATVSESVPSTIDATTTQCRTIRVARSEFKQLGIWKLVVEFSSDQHQGKSETIEVVLR